MARAAACLKILIELLRGSLKVRLCPLLSLMERFLRVRVRVRVPWPVGIRNHPLKGRSCLNRWFFRTP